MSSKRRTIVVLMGLLGTVMLAAGCHKKRVAAPAPPAPPPTPAATSSLTAEPSTIEKGQSATLTWSSQNATDLDLQPSIGKVQANGSTTVSPTESTTYTLTATGPGGSGPPATARVTVTIPAPPPPPPPAPPPAVSETDLFTKNIKDAFFDFDKSNIRPDAQEALSHDADFLKDHSDIHFTIEGHCDERGSEEYNLGLGDRRANSAKAYLVNLGIASDDITTISYGKDRPSCAEHTEQCWQLNRRAHLALGSER